MSAKNNRAKEKSSNGKVTNFSNQSREQPVKTLDFIVPVFNEVKQIEKFIQSLSDYMRPQPFTLRFIIIDDGSTDDTSLVVKSILNDYPIQLLRLSRNFGKEVAITAGLKQSTADACIIIDADFQHPFATINDFIYQWQQGYDMVYAVRDSRQDESRLKRISTKLFYWLMKSITKTNMPEDAGDFRLLDKKVVKALNQCQEYNRFMKGLYAWVGFSSMAVTYTAGVRVAGNSKWHLSKLIDLAITGITSFSSVPLRVWGLVGAVISFLSMIYAGYIVISTLLYGVDTPGFATIMVGILFLGGIQLLSIGILGEYIGRIFDEVKGRPNFIVAETYSSTKVTNEIQAVASCSTDEHLLKEDA